MNFRRWIPTGCVAVGVLVLSTSANAAVKYQSLPSFGPVAIPSNITVDQSSGLIYVAATGENVVDEFKPKGTNEYELAGQITGSEAPNPFAFPTTEPAPVAVANSTEDVYVADPGHRVVDEFNSEGKYICQLSGVGRGCHPNAAVELGSPTTFGELTGVATDSLGNVYVSDYTNGVVDEFGAEGGDVGQIGCNVPGYHPSGVAISSAGVMYVQTYFGEDVVCPSGSVFDLAKSFDLALDPLTEDIYIDHGSSIAVYGAETKMIATFATGLVENGSEGVAVDSAKHLVYVTDKAGGKVLVFEEVEVPDVKLTGEATSVTSASATLHGDINPDNTSGASYYFEYGKATALGSTSPAPPGTPAEGNAYVSAATELTGLEPNTTYHYRLVGTNSSGLANQSNEEGEFTTSKMPPEVAEVEAVEATAGSVLFSAQVNPENDATTYHFEYGETTSYGQTLPDIGIGSGGTPSSVEQASPANLAPETVYHYRIVAENSAGKTRSVDQEFETPDTAAPATTPPTVNLNPITAVSQTGATLSATIGPEGHPTTYIFELGYAAGSYETRIFGNLAGEPEAKTATATFANLQPGTVYHFRVIATNAAGTTATPDQTFATPQFPQTITIPPALALVPIPVFPVVHYPPLPVKCKKGFVKHGRKCVRKKRPSKHKKRHR